MAPAAGAQRTVRGLASASPTSAGPAPRSRASVATTRAPRLRFDCLPRTPARRGTPCSAQHAVGVVAPPDDPPGGPGPGPRAYVLLLHARRPVPGAGRPARQRRVVGLRDDLRVVTSPSTTASDQKSSPLTWTTAHGVRRRLTYFALSAVGRHPIEPCRRRPARASDIRELWPAVVLDRGEDRLAVGADGVEGPLDLHVSSMLGGAQPRARRTTAYRRGRGGPVRRPRAGCKQGGQVAASPVVRSPSWLWAERIECCDRAESTDPSLWWGEQGEAAHRRHPRENMNRERPHAAQRAPTTRARPDAGAARSAPQRRRAAARTESATATLHVPSVGPAGRRDAPSRCRASDANRVTIRTSTGPWAPSWGSLRRRVPGGAADRRRRTLAWISPRSSRSSTRAARSARSGGDTTRWSPAPRDAAVRLHPGLLQARVRGRQSPRRRWPTCPSTAGPAATSSPTRSVGFAVSEFGAVATRSCSGRSPPGSGRASSYVPGSSGPTNGAAETLLGGAGVAVTTRTS